MIDDQQNINTQVRQAYGASNLHMLNAMTAAYSQMLRLIESGFVVLNIRIGARNPVLVVQNNAAVTRLKGASAVRRTGPVGIERVMIARCGQCQIEWIERGN